MLTALLDYDRQLFIVVNAWQGNVWLDGLFLAITYLGTFWLSAGLAGAALWWRCGRAARRPIGLSLLAGVPIAFVGVGLKYLVNRPRPAAVIWGARVHGPLLWNASFPSGHTLTVFSVLGFLWLIDRTLAWCWLPVAVAVAFSRVYLGVHYPGDVLAGAVLGGGLAFLLGKCLKLAPSRPEPSRTLQPKK